MSVKKPTIGDMVSKVKKMQAEPASKEWFAKHGLPGRAKSKALDNKKK